MTGSAGDPLLDGRRIQELLTELGSRLHRRGLDARLFLVGGAAMALAFDVRRATRDLDAVFEPKAEVYSEAASMAEDLGLPPDWLNDGVEGLLPDRHDIEVGARFVSDGISVEVASAEYLFAMKALAARVEVDGADLRLLARHLGLRSAAEAVDLVERYYHPQRIRPVTTYLLEELLDEPGQERP